MSDAESKSRLKGIGGVLLCLAVAAMTAVLVSRFPAQIRRLQPRAEGGFDFRPMLEDNNIAWGPRIGERIDLMNLRAHNGSPLANFIRSDLIMLATIDPECGASRAASDQMRYVSEQMNGAGIQYVLASFTSTISATNFFRFADSLELTTPAYLWDRSESIPPPTLFYMVIPSHILVDRNGIVVRKWPGTNNERPTRERMANQIVSDALVEFRARAAIR